MTLKEQYINQLSPSQTIKLNRIKQYKTQDKTFDHNDNFLLALNNLNFDAVEQMVDQQTINALDCYTLDQLPKNIKSNLGSKKWSVKDSELVNYDKVKTRELTVTHILAFFGMEFGVKKLLKQALNDPDLNYKKQVNTKQFDLLRPNYLNKVYFNIENYDQYIKQNKNKNIMFDLNEIYGSGFFEQFFREKKNGNDIMRSRLPSYNYNADGVVRFAFDATQQINLTGFAIEQDSVELLDYYWSINYQTNNSYQAVLSKIMSHMNDNHESTTIYPKKIIHYLIDHYTNQLYRDFMDVQLAYDNEKEKDWASQTLNSLKKDNTLEKMVIKNKDLEAFHKLMKHNKDFYEQTELLYDLSKYFLNNGLIDNFTTLFYWTDHYNVDLKKSLAYAFFEQSDFDSTNKRQIFSDILKNPDIRQQFIHECNQKNPNYQSNIEKLKFLKQVGVSIDTQQIEQRIKGSFNKIKRDWQKELIATQQCNFVLDNMTISKDVFKKMDQQFKIVNQFYQMKQDAQKAGKYKKLNKIDKYVQQIENFKLKENLTYQDVDQTNNLDQANNVPNDTVNQSKNSPSKPSKKIL